jgi:putative nucleotidyltransferase with HDIG domain
MFGFIKKPDLKLIKTSKEDEIIPNLISTIANLTIENHQQFTDLIRLALKALEEKDPYTEGHSLRVTKYAIKIGKEYGLDKEDLRELELSSLLHDIGKLGIPDSILKKPDRLTKSEYKFMQEHSRKGAEIVAQIKTVSHIKKNILHHHERYNGFGYPDGLKGNKIPIISRIIFIADTFDAMTSKRSYREPFSEKEALEEIERGKGYQFDPKLVDMFLKLFIKKKNKKIS